MKYLRKRKREKLYQQWVDRANLPPDAMPREEVAEDMILQTDKTGKRQSHLNILSILLGITLLIVVAGLILLLMYSC